ncbi:MAG: hypothetical protein IT530_03665 [Burkholderiales bacterium]|nr:hypothetical protein [Burkholderiales bacterium]
MTLLVILLYFIASAFIVLGFMMLFVFRRTRRWELLVLSFVYSGSGLVAGYSMRWWPLVAGFVVAWLLKLAGYNVDAPAPAAGSGTQNAGGDRPADGA